MKEKIQQKEKELNKVEKKEDKVVKKAVKKFDQINKKNTKESSSTKTDNNKSDKKSIASKQDQKLINDKMHKKFEAKPMDPDNSFSAVELEVPKEAVKKDKDLQKSIIPPSWNSYYYYMTSDGVVHKTWFDNIEQAVDHFIKESKKDEKTKNAPVSFLALGNGKIVKSKSQDPLQLQKCIGQAVLDGNLKRKSFG